VDKLLLIGPSPARPGGVATYIRHLTAALEGDASTDWAFFPTDKGTSNSLRGRLSAGLGVARDLRRRLAEADRQFAHICCGSDESGWGLREGLFHGGMCQRAGLRTLLHLHASALPHLLSPERAERRFLVHRLGSADALAVPSDATLDLLAECGIPRSRICVIPNSVPLLPWSPRPHRPGSPLRLLLVGSIEDRKGIEVLLDALAQLAKDHPGQIQVDAYGPAAVSRDRLALWQARGGQLGLRFLGAVPPAQVQQALSASDGLILPSLAECQPFALLEAMAASRPVLASDCGGIGRLLAGGAGDCVLPGDTADLVRALKRWIAQPDHLLRLARGGWERVRDQHSLPHGLAATHEAWDLATQAGTLRTSGGPQR
jgi:glycosyltransferase involved in cell wall biosynthesis